MNCPAIPIQHRCVTVEKRSVQPYPRGWFAVCYSHDVKSGTVRTFPLADGEIVLYRTRSGVLNAINSYCPHFGAHLGHGGKVKGENLVCPFHGYAFGPDGACLRPKNEPPSPGLRLSRWYLRETGGMAWVWYDFDGNPPMWDIPAFDSMEFSRTVYRCTVIAGHMQDSAENGADMGHMAHVHHFRAPVMPEVTIDGHIMVAYTKTMYENRWPFNFRASWYGIGYLIGELEFPGIGLEIRTLGAFTQIGPAKWTLRWSHVARIAAFDALPRLLRLLLNTLVVRLYEPWFHMQNMRDKRIWDYKTHRPHPATTPMDRSVLEYRKWAAQFYPPEMETVDSVTTNRPGVPRIEPARMTSRSAAHE
ncbi:Rieske (2Fe-2S) protein [Burkholderia cenocepacia]|uniref:Rieske 2Fe-2S domain-containing protein n=1 Tax=Burkholderia cenocepacia TaxID=95486 RepID=UPI0028553B5C|nr:Rieske 2Fe-2S domain-containing protein [Burkholderia cenocepacia]MDR8030766.1 Rieske (2Fe-2S) protein [Burkholderia cenocepacia]MDR8041094.1 Rieske (2Fe-2S) protein [Burkholderia cenocepacia]